MRQFCERAVIPDELVVVQLDEGHGERHLAVRRMLEHLARGLHIVRKRAAAAHAEPLVAAEQQQCGAALGHGQNIFLQRDGGGAEQRHDDEEQRQIWLHQAAKLFIHLRSPLPAARTGRSFPAIRLLYQIHTIFSTGFSSVSSKKSVPTACIRKKGIQRAGFVLYYLQSREAACGLPHSFPASRRGIPGRARSGFVTGPADAPSFSGCGCSFRFPSRLHGAELPRPAAFCLTCAFLRRPQTVFTYFPAFRTRRGGRARFFIAAVLRFWVEGPCFVIARPRNGPWQSRSVIFDLSIDSGEFETFSRDSHAASLLGMTQHHSSSACLCFYH